jgi:hypothetical protein
MRLFLVTLAMATAWPAAEAAAQYRYCAQYRDAGRQSCSFTTLAQCQAAVSGDGGFCQDMGGGNPTGGRSANSGGGRKKSSRQN